MKADITGEEGHTHLANTYINRVAWFVALVLMQVLVLDNILLWGVARPLLYVCLILKFSTGTGRCETLLWAFALGLTVDIFSNTPGANAVALTLAAFVRPALLQLFVTRDTRDDAAVVPSVATMGLSAFFKYALSFVLIHHAVSFVLIQFSPDNIGDLLLRILGCSAMTMAFILAIETIRKK